MSFRFEITDDGSVKIEACLLDDDQADRFAAAECERDESFLADILDAVALRFGSDEIGAGEESELLAWRENMASNLDDDGKRLLGVIFKVAGGLP
ncbi:MAG: hypothetical protein HZY79_15685 [Rhodoblastus sp.]|nr:MAG: hypothetical protein HZY79_15685 [Rhodoblastus sp.]